MAQMRIYEKMKMSKNAIFLTELLVIRFTLYITNNGSRSEMKRSILFFLIH